MNIVAAVATIQLDGALSFRDLMKSDKFINVRRKGDLLILHFDHTKKRIAIVLRSKKVIVIVHKTDNADRLIRSFCKKVARRIYRACKIEGGRVHNYVIKNYVAKIATSENNVPVCFKTQNGAKVTFTPNGIVIVNCKSHEAINEALEEAKGRYLEERLHLLNME